MSSAAPRSPGAPEPPEAIRSEGRSATSIARSIARSTFARVLATIVSLDVALALALALTFAFVCQQQLPSSLQGAPLLGWNSQGSALFLVVTHDAGDAGNGSDASGDSAGGSDTSGSSALSGSFGTADTGDVRSDRGRQVLELVYLVSRADGATRSFPVAQALPYALPALGVLGAFELLALLGAAGSTRRIRRRLRPLNELALTAEAVGSAAADASYPWPVGTDEAAGGKDKLGSLERAISSASVDSPRVETGDDDLRSIEVALNGLLRRMQDAQRQQMRFVDDASHELRTPIAVIQGYVDLLDRWGKSNPEVLDESIAALKDETAHMKELVEQLLFLARGDSGRTALTRAPINLAALAQEVVEEYRIIDPGRPYELGAAAAEEGARQDPRYAMVGDAALVKQCVRIIVQNAAKYSGPGAPVRLDVGGAPGQASLSVSDRGTGIGSEELSHVFDRFWRSDQARSGETGGSGLGLSIAKWIMDAHEGRVDVLSAPGVGTRFTLVFPARRGPGEGEAGRKDATPGDAGASAGAAGVRAGGTARARAAGLVSRRTTRS